MLLILLHIPYHHLLGLLAKILISLWLDFRKELPGIKSRMSSYNYDKHLIEVKKNLWI
jgi:hypothetical protein